MSISAPGSCGVAAAGWFGLAAAVGYAPHHFHRLFKRATGVTPAAFARAVAAGATPLKEPVTKPWGQTVAYVRDLDGFLVELCSPIG